MPIRRCPINDCEFATKNVEDALAAVILQGHFVNHTKPQNKAETAKRPMISTGCTLQDWSYFESRWSAYSQGTSLSGHSITSQLLDCCDEPLRVLLYKDKGDLSKENEQTVLAAIKSIVVISENLAVSQKNLLEAKQDRDEPIRTFAARLRGLASMCELTCEIACASAPGGKHKFSYADELLRYVIISGVGNTDIQADILSHTNQKMTLQELIAFIEAKEAGLKSKISLNNSQYTNAVRSSYKTYHKDNPRRQYQKPQAQQYHQTSPLHRSPMQTQNDKPPSSPKVGSHAAGNNGPACDYCGNTGHGDGLDLTARSRYCPAYGRTCTWCQRPNHFKIVCRKRLRNNRTSAIRTDVDEEEPPMDDAGAVFLSAIHTSTQ